MCLITYSQQTLNGPSIPITATSIDLSLAILSQTQKITKRPIRNLRIVSLLRISSDGYLKLYNRNIAI